MLLLKPYIRLIHGYPVDNLAVVDGHTEYTWLGRRIMAPSDGTGSFFEVFHENVYDRIISPKEGDVCLDVGAYVGMWSVRAAMMVGKTGRVLAAEPSPDNQRWLNDNVADLPVTVLPYLVSDHDGREKLYMSPATSCHSTVLKHGTAVDMECHCVDWIAWKHQLDAIDFIKIDAEGAEMKVLQGASRILRAGTKLAIASYHNLPDGVPEYNALMKFLTGIGYQVYAEEGLRRYIYAWKERVPRTHRYD